MKRTLVSIIAGLTVVGSAVAVPTPEDRKALCLKHPDKYVWAEKTSTCIPINPCESADLKIKDAYCVSINTDTLPQDREMRDMIINRYVENMMNTKVSEIKYFTQNDKYISAFKTTDGGYYAIQSERYIDADTKRPCAIDTYSKWAGAAYGNIPKSSLWAASWDDEIANGSGTFIYYKGVKDAQTCKNIADFASLISGTLMTGRIERPDLTRYCAVFCPGPEY